MRADEVDSTRVELGDLVTDVLEPLGEEFCSFELDSDFKLD